MNAHPYSIVSCLLAWFLVCLPGALKAQPGVILTRDYEGQEQEFWKPTVFQNVESAFAAVRVFFADGKDISLPKSKVGKIIFVPDLKTFQLAYDNDLTAVKSNIEELKSHVKSYAQLAALLTPVIQYLEKAADEYKQGYVYYYGKRTQGVEVKPQFKPFHDQNLTVAGFTYSGIQVTKVSKDAVTLMHSKGVATIPKTMLSAEVLSGLQEKWPKPFADFVMLERQETELASAREMNESQRELARENAISHQHITTTEMLKRTLADANYNAEHRKLQLTDKEKASVAQSRVPVAIRVSQATPEGALAYGRRVTQAAGAGGDWAGLHRAPQIIISEEHDEPIFVVGLPNTTVDGETLAGWLYPCGQYRYTTVLGALKTVRKYATSPERAIQELEISQ